MTKPMCPQKSPYVLIGEKKKYAWCACGKSETQPFCDGSHKGTDFSPIIVVNKKKVILLGVVARPLVTHLIVMVHTVSCNN